MKKIKEKKLKRTSKKSKKEGKQNVFVKLVDILKSQADQKNEFDCSPIVDELNEASKSGEYMRTMPLKVNQALYLKTLGLNVLNTEKIGYFTISWKGDE